MNTKQKIAEILESKIDVVESEGYTYVCMKKILIDQTTQSIEQLIKDARIDAIKSYKKVNECIAKSKSQRK